MNIRASRDSSIRWMNSLTNAVGVINGLQNKEQTITVEDNLKYWANFLYNIEPERTELQGKIENAKNIESLESIKEDIVKTDSVELFNLWNEKKIKIG